MNMSVDEMFSSVPSLAQKERILIKGTSVCIFNYTRAFLEASGVSKQELPGFLLPFMNNFFFEGSSSRNIRELPLYLAMHSFSAFDDKLDARCIPIDDSKWGKVSVKEIGLNKRLSLSKALVETSINLNGLRRTREYLRQAIDDVELAFKKLEGDMSFRGRNDGKTACIENRLLLSLLGLSSRQTKISSV